MMIRFLLFSFLIAFGVENSANATSPKREKPDFYAQIRGEETTLWKEVGFTEEDCESKNPSAKTACENRIIVQTNPGDLIRIKTLEVFDAMGNPSYIPVSKVGKALIFGQPEDVLYYEAIFQDREKSIEAFIPAEQLTEPFLRETSHISDSLPEMKTLDPNCPDSSKERPVQIQNQSLDILTSLMTPKIDLKKDSDLERFVCLHRYDSEDKDFLSKDFKKFKGAAKQAEKSIGIPQELLLCGILAESSFRKGQTSSAGAKGYVQIMPNTMKTIMNLPGTRTVDGERPYAGYWQEYLKSKETKDSALTNEKVRLEDHIGSNVGAMALFFRYLFDNYVSPAAKSGLCKDCSADLKNLQRKDLYLMLVGYNAGQGYVKKVAGKSPAQLHRENPPPDETRKYIEKIERCLSQGKELSFSDSPKDIQNTNRQREREIRQIEKEIKDLEALVISHSQKSKARAQRDQLVEKKKTDPSIRLPAQVYVPKLPSDIDQKIAARRKRLKELRDLIKHEASASFGNRMDACGARLPAPPQLPSQNQESEPQFLPPEPP